MTDKQWNALKMMTKRDHGQNLFPSTFSWGKVTLRETDEGFELEYPSYSVSLYRDSDISNHDKYYLHYLYSKYMSI
jgi:hypothetical protein